MHAATSGGVTLVFVNPSNNHWRLIVVDDIQHHVLMFDPLGTPLPTNVVDAVRTFVGPMYRILDVKTCLQAESWNCGVWPLFMASRYINAVVAHLTGPDPSFPVDFRPRDDLGDYTVLHEDSTSAERQQNRRFAAELRSQYCTLLVEAHNSGRLLFTLSSAIDGEEQQQQHRASIARVRDGYRWPLLADGCCSVCRVASPRMRNGDASARKQRRASSAGCTAREWLCVTR
jgi:hypothetical protein